MNSFWAGPCCLLGYFCAVENFHVSFREFFVPLFNWRQAPIPGCEANHIPKGWNPLFLYENVNVIAVVS